MCVQSSDVSKSDGTGVGLPVWGRVTALSYTGMPSPTLLKALSVITYCELGSGEHRKRNHLANQASGSLGTLAHIHHGGRGTYLNTIIDSLSHVIR